MWDNLFNQETIDEAIRGFKHGMREFAHQMREEARKASGFSQDCRGDECRGGEGQRKGEGGSVRWNMDLGLFPFYDSRNAEDGTLVFRFLLPGCDEAGIQLTFAGDTMVLKAKLSDSYADAGKDKPFFLYNVERREYHVPAARYDQAASKAVLRNGVLTVSIPSVENSDSAFKVEIVKEGN